jgi:hypothetical protein
LEIILISSTVAERYLEAHLDDDEVERCEHLVHALRVHAVVQLGVHVQDATHRHLRSFVRLKGQELKLKTQKEILKCELHETESGRL